MTKNVAIILIGVFIIFGAIWWGVSTELNNGMIINKTITIKDKICPTPLNNIQPAKAQDIEGNIYFIPTEKCEKYAINKTINIRYNHIHQMTIGDWADYNKIIGDDLQ